MSGIDLSEPARDRTTREYVIVGRQGIVTTLTERGGDQVRDGIMGGYAPLPAGERLMVRTVRTITSGWEETGHA
jgi:hypothetical protein